MLDDLIEKGAEVQTVFSQLFPQDCHVLGQSKPDASRFHQFKVPGGRVRAIDRLLLLIRCGERYRLVSHRNSLELARVQSRLGANEKTKHKRMGKCVLSSFPCQSLQRCFRGSKTSAF